MNTKKEARMKAEFMEIKYIVEKCRNRILTKHYRKLISTAEIALNEGGNATEDLRDVIEKAKEIIGVHGYKRKTPGEIP